MEQKEFTCFLLQGSVYEIYSQETEISVAYRIKFRTLNELLALSPSKLPDNRGLEGQ